MLKKNMRRLWLLCALLLLVVPAAMAQGTHTLVPGTPIAGALDENNLVQVYTLQGGAGQALTVTASNQIGVPLALVLTDASGTIIAQNYDKSVTGQVTLDAITLPLTGTYFVTLFKSAGVESVSLVNFSLTAELTSPAATTPEATVQATAEATVAPTTVPSEGTPRIDAVCDRRSPDDERLERAVVVEHDRRPRP